MAKRKHRAIYGSTVAITGGARGIGLATVAALADRGARVAVGDIDLDELERALANVNGTTKAFYVDVTSRQSVTEFADAVDEQFGTPDVIINNAGVMSLSRFLDEPDEVTFRQRAINVDGVIFGMKVFMPRMLANGGGHVINIGSGASKFGFAGAATYSATKHAVYGLTEGVAAEMRKDPIDFSVVMPTVVQTELTAGLKRKPPLTKAQTPEDVAIEIVKAIQRPHFDVFVPPIVSGVVKVTRALPHRTQTFFERMLHTDQTLTDIDDSSRSDYVKRAFGRRD